MRFIVFVIGAMLVSGVCQAQSEGPLTTYRFLELQQNPFDKKHSATDPDALYSYYLADESRGMRIGSGMSYQEVQGLMKYFHVSSPAELVGKSFSSDLPHDLAMNLLEVQANHDFKYKAPSKEELYQRAVQSLAQMSCPNFDDVDNATSLQAFQVGWGEEGDAYFAKLRDDVAKASGGKVILSEDKASDHQITCGCIGAKNARITDGLSKIELIFTPGLIDPFMCEKKEIAVDPNKAMGSLTKNREDDRRVVQTSSAKSVVAADSSESAPVTNEKVQGAAAK